MNRWMGAVIGITISLSALAIGGLYPVDANGIGCGTAFREDTGALEQADASASGTSTDPALGPLSGLIDQFLGGSPTPAEAVVVDFQADCDRARTQVRVLTLTAAAASAVIALAWVLLGATARSDGSAPPPSPTAKAGPDPTEVLAAPPAWPGGPPAQGGHDPYATG